MLLRLLQGTIVHNENTDRWIFCGNPAGYEYTRRRPKNPGGTHMKTRRLLVPSCLSALIYFSS
ncbi:MAG: hypothetical protein ACXWYD_17690, partial [Candidatus Binatia bacterium]